MSQPETSQPVKVENVKQPSLPAKKPTAKAEVKPEQTAALSGPEQAPKNTVAAAPAKKPEKKVAKASAPAKTESVKAEKPAAKPAVKVQTVAAASESPIRQVNYSVDGDPNFIRAWPYE